jgi:hypothetical protein
MVRGKNWSGEGWEEVFVPLQGDCFSQYCCSDIGFYLISHGFSSLGHSEGRFTDTWRRQESLNAHSDFLDNSTEISAKAVLLFVGIVLKSSEWVLGPTLVPG